MEFYQKVLRLKKRHPLTISRGTRAYSENVFLFISDGSHVGIGECDPACMAGDNEDAVVHCQSSLDEFLKHIDLDNLAIYELEKQALLHGLAKPAQAALDMALWDLYGKQCGQPCYRLFGLRRFAPATSITLGLTALENISERVEELLAPQKFRSLKIKLGSPQGINFDQEAFTLIETKARKFGVEMRVDANGGWSLAQAKIMCRFLAKHGVSYVEQPLAPSADEELKELFINRPLAIFVDESCHIATDIPRLSAFVDGINIKLMKCGGVSECLRMVATARAHGLKTMIGCMSESSIALSAAASMGSLFDYIDLDSAFNLDPDPACGPLLVEGVLLPSEFPGHGARLC